MNERGLVLKLLLRVQNDGGYSNILLDSELERYDFNTSQKAFVTALFYGVIERSITLDYYISRLSKTKINKLSPVILNILRIGIYQIEYLNSVPDSAAVNECVLLTKKNENPRLSGFVNAVLRSYIRERENLSLPPDGLERLSVLYSCPKPLVKKLCDEYGDKAAQEFLKSSLEPAKLFVRVNTLKTDAKTLSDILISDGVRIGNFGFDENVLCVSGKALLSSAFKNGLFYVQDYSSQLAARSLGAQSGERILDICSAPGSKAFTLALDMRNKGQIVACDLYEHKISLIKKGAERLGIGIINARVSDATAVNSAMGKFDRVLCDVPCSGFGIIKRKPEIKYKPLDEINNLPRLQRMILENAAGYLKHGGVLVYSTCTLNRDENDKVIDGFLRDNKDYEAVREFDGDHKKTIMPKDFGSDAFFISKIRRKDQW